jgi:thiamine-phosphate pyrophosphorylase
MPTPSANLTAGERLAALRIVDANFNRASEGLRAVEEYFRFAAGEAAIVRELKELRHRLAQAVSAIGGEELAKARDTTGDVGTEISVPSQPPRRSLADVATANWKRVEQALRALEEYGQLLALDAAAIGQLRYRAYTLGKTLATRLSSDGRLASVRLMVLIDGGAADRFDEADYRQQVAVLVQAGVQAIQLRDKRLADRQLLARAKIVRELTREGGTMFIFNDRPDLAVISGADGVHVGQEDLPAYEARRIVGTQALVGVSTHDLDQVRQAVLDGADYLGCGPTFPSSTKQFDRLAGQEFLRQAAAEISLPAFAIGGITLENLPQVLKAGFRRVAVSAAVWQASDPAAVVRGMLARLAEE